MRPPIAPLADEDVRTFIEEFLRNGLMLIDVLSTLLEDLPDDAFPGEDTGDVVVEMLAGTVAPAAHAAGAETVRGATALIGAVGDRTLADLQAALELKRGA